jgi:hypothetical protein
MAAADVADCAQGGAGIGLLLLPVGSLIGTSATGFAQ